MTDWADCADAVWDILSGTEAPNDYVTVLKRISSWLQEDRGEDWSDPLSHTLSFVNDHFVNLQFLLWRRRKLFLHSTFDIDQIHARCALWAVEFVEHRMRVEICRASASRFYMASVLGSAVLVLSLYLLDTEKPAPDPPADFRRPYDSALKMLRELATSVPVARRILDDLQKPIDLVQNPPLEPLEEITASMPFNSPDFEEKASPSNLPEWESEFGGIDGIGRVDPSVGEGRQHGVLWV